MRTILLLLSFLFAVPQPSPAQTVDIQLLYHGTRNPRHLITTARRHYRAIGIDVRITPIQLPHIERPSACGLPLLEKNFDIIMPFLPGGRRTIILTPPPLDPWGRETLCGVAPICGITGAVSRVRKDPNGTAWVLIHEIAHMLGATHTHTASLLSPAKASGAWHFEDRSVREMKACMRW